MAKIRITRKGDFEMKRRIKEFNNLVRRGLPKIVGNEAVNFSKESFRKQGFTDGSFKKWQSRKNNKDKGRAILVKSGDLRRSIKKRVRSKRVTISSNLPYSPVHNYGQRAGRGKGFKMPKRKFLGRSKTLNKQIKRTIKREVDKILK